MRGSTKALAGAAALAALVLGSIEIVRTAEGGSGPARQPATSKGAPDVLGEAAAGGGQRARILARLGALGRGEGADFVSVCPYSHSNQDDPIVFPGQVGATHHHDFFGNGSTDAYSTYSSLRSADTTCRIAGDTAAYWTPSLWVDGRLVEPVLARVYYLTGGKDHATIRPPPRGLRIVAKEKNVEVRWACTGRGVVGSGQETPPVCPSGEHLVERIRFPDCWDGLHLDSPDHTSHMTFAAKGARRGRLCPASHPVPLPAISLNVHYPTRGGQVALGFPEKPVPAHADFFNAWDQATLDRLVVTCLDAGVRCGDHPPAEVVASGQSG